MIPILAFDSPDKCGKDTLIYKFHKATDFIYPCINRFTGTSYSYGKFWNRESAPFEEYLKLDISLFDKIILIYLDAPNDVLAKRFEEHNEKDININDMDKIKKCYSEYLEKTPYYTIKVDTSQPFETCVEQIKKGIEDFKNESPQSKQSRLLKTVKQIGDDVSGTKEIRNVEMNFKYGQIQENELYKTLQDTKLWNPQELYEYNEIKSTLMNSIRTKLWYLKNQDSFSRQFTFSSNSCISFVQVVKRNNKTEFYFTLRSSNIEKMFLQDIWGIQFIVDEINQKFFRLPYNINIRIISAHIYDDSNKRDDSQK